MQAVQETYQCWYCCVLTECVLPNYATSTGSGKPLWGCQLFAHFAQLNKVHQYLRLSPCFLCNMLQLFWLMSLKLDLRIEM